MAGSRFPIVAIGASAGGVEALQAFFKPMPTDAGVAFVVITHIGERQESALPQILARVTALPVRAIRDGELIEVNHVHVLTSNAVATVQRGRLRLRQRAEGSREYNTIDVFLASLAADAGDQSIAVILSGSGHDGTLGAKAIKEQGGLTIAQIRDHGAPVYPEMPGSAVASGVVDLQIPVEQMAERLVDYVRRLGTLETRGQNNNRAERHRIDRARREICEALRDQIGHDFSGYKPRTFMRRVERRMQVLTLHNINDYVEYLREDPREAINLLNDLLIGVTAFFRDTEAFQALADKVVPVLFEGKGESDTVRVWVAGCATGEEVYSLAILLLEHLDTLRVRPRVMCFATDIDESAITVARAARYPVAMLQNVSPERIERFFTFDGVGYAPTKQVRDLCVFSSHSVIRDPPFSRIDLISCRNLLIYMDKSLQNLLIPAFHYALRPRGCLFLGISESLAEHSQLFSVVDQRFRIFQRRTDTATPLPLPLAILEPGRRLNDARSGQRNDGMISLRQVVDARVVEQFAPPHVVVTADGDVVHFSARTGRYLEHPVGIPNRNVVMLARSGLRLDLRNALSEAVETHHRVYRSGVRVELDGPVQVIDLTVEPLPGQDHELFLIVFTDVEPGFRPDPAFPTVPGVDTAAAEQVERALRECRERLRSVSEEYETALEELKSANEELVSINEELQSTNEELETAREEAQSVNEEATMVNAELQRELEELDRANNTLRNLFEGTQIAIVFLDEHLVVRSFTPAIRSIFSLMDSDRGRPLTDIVSELDDLQLNAEVMPVLGTGQPRERRVVHRDGKVHYLMRILPYYTKEKKQDGVLVTFTDITCITEIEEYQRELSDRIQMMLQMVVDIAERSLATEAASDGMLARLRALGEICSLIAAAKWGAVGLGDLAARELGNYGIGREGRIVVEGAELLLRARAAASLGMALHELAMQAASQGALSVPQGRVHLGWTIAQEDTPEASLVVEWKEAGGPKAPGPRANDYCGELLKSGLAREIGAQGALDLADDGASATLTLPLSSGLVLRPPREGDAKRGG